jgi:hypothetical protein
MSELSDKILRSGLIDKHTAELLEKYGLIESSDVEKVPEGAPLANATKQQLTKFADELAEIVERDVRLKESYLDLEKLRWPVTVIIKSSGGEGQVHVDEITALVDRMGRYYIRPQDINIKAVVPGFTMVILPSMREELIVEAQPLYVGDVVAAIQVATQVK